MLSSKGWERVRGVSHVQGDGRGVSHALGGGRGGSEGSQLCSM